MKLPKWLGKRVPWYVRITRTLVLLYVATLVVLISQETALVYPRSVAGDDWKVPRGVREIWLTASDGSRINGWYLDIQNPNGHLIFFHGNGGDMRDREIVMRRIAQRCNVSVLAIDYHGYGRSSGIPTEAGVVEDGMTAANWLAKQAQVEPSELVVMGRSLGGAVAIQVAAELQTKALILESTFTTLPAAASRCLPVLRVFPLALVMSNQYDSAQHIQRYEGPLLQSHGTADRIVRYSLGRDLHEVAAGPKQFIEIPNGRHNDPQPAKYYSALETFLETALDDRTDLEVASSIR